VRRGLPVRQEWSTRATQTVAFPNTPDSVSSNS
jgi:hypothetical protein